jgi:hypothetical protein
MAICCVSPSQIVSLAISLARITPDKLLLLEKTTKIPLCTPFSSDSLFLSLHLIHHSLIDELPPTDEKNDPDIIPHDNSDDEKDFERLYTPTNLNYVNRHSPNSNSPTLRFGEKQVSTTVRLLPTSRRHNLLPPYAVRRAFTDHESWFCSLQQSHDSQVQRRLITHKHQQSQLDHDDNSAEQVAAQHLHSPAAERVSIRLFDTDAHVTAANDIKYRGLWQSEPVTDQALACHDDAIHRARRSHDDDNELGRQMYSLIRANAAAQR